ncbi:MAG: TolC family protein [Acidobacteriota bacterium]
MSLIKRYFMVFLPLAIFMQLLPSYSGEQEEGEADFSGTLELDSLILYAIEHNPELESLRKQIEAANSRIPQARALEDPMFEIEVDSVPIDTINLSEAMQIKYTATQRMPFRGKLSLQGDIASKSAIALKDIFHDREREIISKVKKSYYKIYLADKSIQINRENKKIMTELEEIARTKYSVGEGTQQDVLKALVELINLDNELILLEQEMESARAELNRLLNRPSLAPIGMPRNFEYKELKISIDSLQKAALERRPILTSLQNMIEMNKLALALSKKQYYPDFSTGFSYGQTNMGRDRWSLMVGLNIPLWYRKKQAYGVIEAENNLKSSMADYEAARNLVLFEVRDSYLRVSSSFKKLELYKDGIIPQAEQSFKSAIAGYKTNLIDFLTLLDNWRTLLRFWLDYHSLLAQYQQDLSDLEFAVGGTLSEISGE